MDTDEDIIQNHFTILPQTVYSLAEKHAQLWYNLDLLLVSRLLESHALFENINWLLGNAVIMMFNVRVAYNWSAQHAS